MTKSAPVEPVKRQSFGLGFEFPTLMSAPSSSVHTAPKPASPVTYSPPASPSTRKIPPPASPRLSKLNLLNYAAPATTSRSPLNSPLASTTNSPNISTAPEVRVTPPESPQDEYGRTSSPLSSTSSTTPRAATATSMPQTLIGGYPATSSFADTQMQGLALHWPWGFSPSTRSGLVSPLNSPPGSGSNSPRRFSPKNMSPLSSLSSSPQSRSGTSSPKLGVETVADQQLYNELVKKFCFAQGPGPGPGHGFSGIDLADGVLVA